MRHLVIDTRLGRTVFLGVRDARPLCVVFHAAFRDAKDLLHLVDRLSEYSILFAKLPGHGAPFLDAVGVDPWVDAYSEAVSALNPQLVIGESVGALIALAMPAPRVVAIEPFFEPAKLWPLQQFLQRARAAGRELYKPFCDAMFTGTHWPVLGRITAKTLVIAGDEPLFPVREAARYPSFLLDSDLACFQETVRIPGGHALLDYNVLGCTQEIRAWLGSSEPVDLNKPATASG